MESIRADDLVLVAILPEPRDLEFARVLGWYRIPLERAPKSPHVDWIAFYLPGAFNEGRWSVRYAARVRGVELVRRNELLRDEADHPRAADPYLKFQLGPLFELKRPILAWKWDGSRSSTPPGSGCFRQGICANCGSPPLIQASGFEGKGWGSPASGRYSGSDAK